MKNLTNRKIALSSLALSGALFAVFFEVSTAHALPNPAAQYCTKKGGTLKALTVRTGGAETLCSFGRAMIGEWTLFHEKRSRTQAVKAFCSERTSDSESGGHSARIANPASAYCQRSGGALDILTEAGGGEVGVCRFQDRSSIEEWTLFYGKDGDPNSQLAQVLNCP